MTTTHPRYEPLEHTAEAGIVAYGATLAEAFANVAEGMYDLIVDLDGVEERETRDLAVEGESSEKLLVGWLLELIFLTETEGLVFRRFQVDELSDTKLRARAWGEPFDPERHHSNNVMVKAVTQYLLEIREEDGGYRVQVLFDI
jgi:SHS2 domain-containing protein